MNNDKFVLSFYEIFEMSEVIKTIREEDISISLNIKLGLIEDDISDRYEFYKQAVQQINSNNIEFDDKGQPIYVDGKGNELTKKEVEKIPEAERSVKLKDPQKFRKEMLELRFYPVDVSNITETVSASDLEELDVIEEKERRKMFADALIPLIKRKSRLINTEDLDDVKPFKDTRKEIIDKFEKEAQEKEKVEEAEVVEEDK